MTSPKKNPEKNAAFQYDTELVGDNLYDVLEETWDDPVARAQLVEQSQLRTGNLQELALSRLAAGESTPEEAERLFRQMADDPELQKEFEANLLVEAILEDAREAMASQGRDEDAQTGSPPPLEISKPVEKDPSEEVEPIIVPKQEDGPRASLPWKVNEGQFSVLAWINAQRKWMVTAATVIGLCGVMGAQPEVQLQVALLQRNQEAVVSHHRRALFEDLSETPAFLGRLSPPDADRVRAFETVMAPEPKSTIGVLDAYLVEDLQHVGACRTLAAAWLFRGQTAQANRALQDCEPSANVFSDRAAIALAESRRNRRKIADVFRWTDAALSIDARHRQALWNRGMALRKLGFDLSAADVFSKVEQQEDDLGWDEVAAAHTERLRQHADDFQASYQAALQAGRALVESGTPVPKVLLETQSGLMRLFFYDALRAADSAEAVQRLAPMAEFLDERSPVASDFLGQAVKTAHRQDFSKVGPWARTYRRLALGQLSRSEVDTYIAELTDAQESHLLMSALIKSRRAARHLDRLGRLAAEVEDPWFSTFVLIQQGKRAMQENQFELAEAYLLEAKLRAASQYRKLSAETELAQLYIEYHRPADAETTLKQALARAQATLASGSYLRLLVLKGRHALLSKQPHLARATFEEATRINETYNRYGRCAMAQYIRLHQAEIEVQEQRPTAALALLAPAKGCKNTDRAFALSVEISSRRMSANMNDEGALEARLKQALASSTAGVERALLQILQGRWWAQEHSVRGIDRVHEGLAALAAQTPTVVTQRVELVGYATLISEYARLGRFDAALNAFAKEIDATLPATCVLGVQIDDERRIVAYRNAEGKVQGQFDGQWNVPQSELDAQEVISDAVWSELAACPEVAILARPPLAGEARLVPAHTAWYFLLGTGFTAETPPDAKHRLVVSNVDFGYDDVLEKLPYYAPSDPKALTFLEGREATKANIMEAMPTATEIEFFTHGWFDAASTQAASLVVSPAPGAPRGRLTAADIAELELRGEPVVALAACSAVGHARYRRQLWSLPAAFIQAGARAVFGPSTPIRTSLGRELLEQALTRVRQGRSPAQALRDVRMAEASSPEEREARAQLVVFQR